MSIAVLVIVAYMVLLPTISLALSRGQHGDPSRAHHDLPAWAICLSIVATETSTLTVVSVPGVAYGRSFVFTGLAIGYLIGRVIVALFFLPLFRDRDMASAYEYLGQRFGSVTQRLVSATFLVTRVLAESVRLFAGMLPVAALCAASGLPGVTSPFGRLALLIVIMALTLSYTMLGGLRAVIWSDSIQLVLYLTGAFAGIAILLHRLPDGALAETISHARLFSHGLPPLTDPFTFAAAILGGTVLTLASHGTDQLMIQRCLAARSLRGAQSAMIGSALLVAVLFTSLSLIGALLSTQNHAAPLATPDHLFPDFILTLPPALCGLLVAGILAATMGSLSSAMNAMTGAVMGDFRPLLARFPWPETALSRGITAFWGAALIVATLAFSGGPQSTVLFAFSITSYCYGTVLGVFLLAMTSPRATGRDALIAFAISVLTVATLSRIELDGHGIAFSWLVPAGAVAGLAAGRLSSLRT
ncbi:sodium:solute symporter [Brytella acorum]|uniref:Sodium:solute symporter n=1 Tax=Brytella acorum TaxID=2959299 RepID=A0AA35XWQ0_9PROT|nr:sodium:solute symporter [Brytella acorum]MDF3625611.1 sodium:solute symporter [Brytella acorum]CAI9119476.1 sodium:solute symporter [Brytella acorum]